MLPMGIDGHIRNPKRRRVSTQVASWTTFSPMALGADGWWDASDESTLTKSGSSVSQWNDKSGLGRNFVQATAANQPVTGTNTLNGLTTITFDGVNDGMTANGGVSGKVVTSMFVVMKMITQGTTINTGFSQGGSGTFFASRILYRNTGNALTLDRWGGGYAASNWDVGGPFHCFGVVINSATSLTLVRDRETFTGTAGTLIAMLSNNVDIGYFSSPSPQYWSNIAVAEVVLFHRTVTPQERLLLTDYFSAKWGLGI